MLYGYYSYFDNAMLIHTALPLKANYYIYYYIKYLNVTILIT